MAANTAPQPQAIHPDARPKNDSPRRRKLAWRRKQREAQQHTGPDDPVTKSSRVYFFIMLAIIAGAFAAFLIFRPQ